MYSRFNILGHSFPSYWTMFCVGLLLMMAINVLRRRKLQFHWYQAVLYTLFLALFSLAGAKLLYAMENWQKFLSNGVTLDGVSFFGAVFFLPLSMYLVCRWRRIPYGAFMDYCAPSLMAMLAVLRVACYLNGCCGGITYHVTEYTTAVVPTQMIECVGDLTILGILLLVEWHYEGEGLLYPCILVLYGCLRFVLEFFRDTPKDWLHLSHGQWFSLVSIAVGGYFLHRLMKKLLEKAALQKRKKGNQKKKRSRGKRK